MSIMLLRAWMVLSATLPGVCFLAGCGSKAPKIALALGAQSLERRHISSRRFVGVEETKLLIATAGLLQDLGFTIDAGQTSLGFVAASKDRKAVEGAQVAGKVLLGLIGKHIAIDKKQKFRASIVTQPVGNDVIVRATFQRMVWDEDGRISRRELLDDPKIYQEFFDKLSKAVFLQGHSL